MRARLLNSGWVFFNSMPAYPTLWARTVQGFSPCAQPPPHTTLPAGCNLRWPGSRQAQLQDTWCSQLGTPRLATVAPMTQQDFLLGAVQSLLGESDKEMPARACFSSMGKAGRARECVSVGLRPARCQTYRHSLSQTPGSQQSAALTTKQPGHWVSDCPWATQALALPG